MEINNEYKNENYKKEMKINDILYGVNNEIYTIESINNKQIIVKYLKKIHITYNSGNNQETRIKEEDLYFLENDIGIKLFFCIFSLFSETIHIQHHTTKVQTSKETFL